MPRVRHQGNYYQLSESERDLIAGLTEESFLFRKISNRINGTPNHLYAILSSMNSERFTTISGFFDFRQHLELFLIPQHREQR